jgi:hypothetical protein
MRRRSGRPRANLEQKILAEMSQHEQRMEAIVAENLGQNLIDRFLTSLAEVPLGEAAKWFRLTLEYGSEDAIARCAALVRKKVWARDTDPDGKFPNRKLLEHFIEVHAPGWDWRKEADEGKQADDIEERFAKERAEDARWRMAHATKFYTPDAPDGVLLCVLAWEYRKRRRIIRRVWPTLRELKLATAIPERTLKKIIKRLRPKKGEIIKLPLRHKFSRRGALPLRYGPRLVIGVLNEFLNRLPEFPIDDAEQKRLRKTALLVKRAFAARLNASCRST